jgi:hypothetical protein
MVISESPIPSPTKRMTFFALPNLICAAMSALWSPSWRCAPPGSLMLAAYAAPELAMASAATPASRRTRVLLAGVRAIVASFDFSPGPFPGAPVSS